MLTVRHISINAGQEDVVEGAKIEYSRGENGAPSGICVLTESRELLARFEEGRVYVMNSAGKTVADYLLSTKDGCQPTGSYSVINPVAAVCRARAIPRHQIQLRNR